MERGAGVRKRQWGRGGSAACFRESVAANRDHLKRAAEKFLINGKDIKRSKNSPIAYNSSPPSLSFFLSCALFFRDYHPSPAFTGENSITRVAEFPNQVLVQLHVYIYNSDLGYIYIYMYICLYVIYVFIYSYLSVGASSCTSNIHYTCNYLYLVGRKCVTAQFDKGSTRWCTLIFIDNIDLLYVIYSVWNLLFAWINISIRVKQLLLSLKICVFNTFHYNL